jgi:hypothetical protein
MKEKEQRKINDWESLVDQLQVQVDKGTEEVKEEFENQKKNLSAWLDTLREKMDEAKEIGGEKAQQVKIKWEELRVQAALAKAETEDEVEAQQKNIALGIHELKHEFSQVREASKEKIEDVKEDVEDKLEDYQTRFDLFRLQMHLGKAEKEEEWEEKKGKLNERLSQLKSRLQEKREDIGDNWEEFHKDISDRLSQIRDPE